MNNKSTVGAIYIRQYDTRTTDDNLNYIAQLHPRTHNSMTLAYAQYTRQATTDIK